MSFKSVSTDSNIQSVLTVFLNKLLLKLSKFWDPDSVFPYSGVFLDGMGEQGCNMFNTSDPTPCHVTPPCQSYLSSNSMLLPHSQEATANHRQAPVMKTTKMVSVNGSRRRVAVYSANASALWRRKSAEPSTRAFWTADTLGAGEQM